MALFGRLEVDVTKPVIKGPHPDTSGDDVFLRNSIASLFAVGHQLVIVRWTDPHVNVKRLAELVMIRISLYRKLLKLLRMLGRERRDYRLFFDF
jgi:hypothetical protein